MLRKLKSVVVFLKIIISILECIGVSVTSVWYLDVVHVLIGFCCSQRGPDVTSKYARNSMIETKAPISTKSRTIKCNHCSIVNQQGLFYTVKSKT